MSAPRDGALVMGADYKSLGVVRSLGRHGIPVWVLRDDHLLAGWSRYCARTIAWPADSDAVQVERLRALARTHGLDGWTLFPGGEETAAFVARNASKLQGCFRLGVLASWEALQNAYDKRLTYRLASRIGVDIPLTRFPRDRADVSAYDGGFPAILKPAIRRTLNEFTIAKAWPASDKATLLARYGEACELVDPALVMIQEVIPGGGESQLSYAALCRAGEPIASLTARRARQWPADFGRASTYVETIEAPDVDEIARQILSALRFDGIVEIEFKRDPRDGRLRLLDVNPRVWGWHTLGRRAGIDFPYLLWRMIHGESIAPARGRAGVRWVRGLTDLPTALGSIKRGELSPLAYVGSLLPPIELAVLAPDDPLPALLELPAVAYLAWRRRRVGEHAGARNDLGPATSRSR